MIALVVIVRRNSPNSACDHFADSGNKTASDPPSTGKRVVDRVRLALRLVVGLVVVIGRVNLHIDPDRGRAGWRWDLLQGGDCQH